MHAKPGDTVAERQPLLTLHTDTPDAFGYALEALTGAYSVAAPGTALTPKPIVLERIG